MEHLFITVMVSGLLVISTTLAATAPLVPVELYYESQ